MCSFVHMQGQKFQVAVLEPTATQGTTAIEKAMIRGELIKQLSRHPNYAAFSRTEIDQIMSEQNFQRTGMVNDASIKKIGELQGVDFIAVSKITKEGNTFYLEAYLVNIESGQFHSPATEYGVLSGGYENMLKACAGLAQAMVGNSTNNFSYSNYAYKGTLQLEDGMYEGDIVNNLPHGQGTITYTMGDIYKGSWMNGKREGYGRTDYNNDDDLYYYEGNYQNDQRNGHGIMVWKDGKRYEGDWKDGAIHGQGIWLMTGGYRYEGSFENNEMSGWGVLVWKDGRRYQGYFANSQINGKGKLYYAENDEHGRLYCDGLWKNGKGNGKSIVYYKDGSRIEGESVNDKPDGYWTYYPSANASATHILVYENGEYVRTIDL